MPESAPRLVLGPMLRHADAEGVAVWLETSAPCTVTVRAGTARAQERTFTVHGRHYAIVDIALDRPAPYRVELDGRQVWPMAGMPPTLARPLTRLRRVVFGSCRTAVPHDGPFVRSHGVDVLRSYGLRLMERGPDELPDLILLLGDQIYADELAPAMREFIAARRSDGPEEVVDFAEYAELYRQAWSDPAVRWLLAAVPTLMMFDDHDIRDDWNTSRAWRERMAGVSWWRRRIVSGLGSYFVYQHLGNLSRKERDGDPVLAALKAGSGGAALDALAARADEHPGTVRWSFSRDIGDVRLIMLDSRSARVLEPGRRRMLDPGEWKWFEERATGGVSHLLIGTSLPVLLPSGIHHVESWNEALCDGAWGRRVAVWSERLRQFLDLEHWAAFRRSFEDLARVLLDVSAGRRGEPPATVLLLSGDVHYSYLASVRRRRGRAPQIHQLVCSPIRNPLGRTLRIANVLASLGLAGAVGRALSRTAGIPRAPLRWKITKGPWFANALATIDLAPGAAVVTWSGHDADLAVARLGPDR